MTETHPNKLCLIEDDPIMGESLLVRLELEGLDCEWFHDGKTAIDALASDGYAAIVSDIRLPDIDGEALFKTLLERGTPVPPSLFITAYGSIDQAVRLLRLGARDYITKPFDLADLLDKLRALSPALFQDSVWNQRELVLGISPSMRHVQDLLARAAAHGARILLTGESGVGKEHAARYFHDLTDPEGSRPFEAVNCAAIQESLLEAELFGHEKGAFTGAIRTRPGVFERAHRGTLLLDEVGDMSLAMQSKLLRVLQDGRVERVGGGQAIHVKVQLVCATHRDLEQMVEHGEFREDLYYRVNVVNVHLPPLRERTEDVLWFARMFLDRYHTEQRDKRVLSPAAERYLQQQPWPGNVRELQHAVERACVLSEDTVLEIPDFERETIGMPNESTTDEGLKNYMERCESAHILRSLEEHDWHIGETADVLRISRKNLWEKMRRYDIRRSD